MPDLASMLVRSSIGTLASRAACCGQCRRTPLAGERVHEVDGGHTLCDLCFAGLPDDRRLAVRTERTTFSEPATAIDRFKEIGAAGWIKRKTRKSLDRLRMVFEEPDRVKLT